MASSVSVGTIIKSLVLLFLCVRYAELSGDRESVMLWSVNYKYAPNSIKQIYGEPEEWARQLLSGQSFKPRDLTSGNTPREFSTLAVHSEKGLVFWFDLVSRKIEYGQVLYNSSGAIRPITNRISGEVEAMVVDWINDDIYWSVHNPSANSSVIYKAAILDPFLTTETVITENLNRISGLQVVPQRGYLFMSDAQRQVIERTDLSGQHRMTFPLQENPSSLAIDFENQRVFWLGHSYIYADYGVIFGAIKSYTWDGTDKKSLLVRRNLIERVKMDIHKNIIFLTMKGKTGFEMVWKDTGRTLINANLRSPGVSHDIKILAQENQPREIRSG